MEKERKLTKKERFGIMKEIVERADINEDERAEALEFIEDDELVERINYAKK